MQPIRMHPPIIQKYHFCPRQIIFLSLLSRAVAWFIRSMSESAKAVVFTAPHQVDVQQVPLPTLEPWDVTVEVESSAISLGTERWALLGTRPKGDVTFPCIPGYLSIGRITKCGASAAERYQPGDRINFLSARIPEGFGGNWMCGHLNPAVVHVNPSDLGGFEGMPYVERVPSSLASETATLAGLAAVACRGIDMAGIEVDQKVVVVGQGVIGHAAAQICRLMGAQVLTADTLGSRVALSREYAADIAVNSKSENLAAAVADFTDGQGADVVIDTTGSMAMLDQEIDYLRRFGKFILQGWYPPPNTLDFHKMHLKFARLFFPCGHSGVAVSRCMQWMARGQLQLAPLITHRFAPEQASEAYDLILNRPQDTMAIIFDWA